MALDPSYPGAIEEMESGVRDFGLPGNGLYGSVLSNIAGAAVRPFFERAVRNLGLHPAPPTRNLRQRTLKYSLPLFIDELAILIGSPIVAVSARIRGRGMPR